MGGRLYWIAVPPNPSPRGLTGMTFAGITVLEMSHPLPPATRTAVQTLVCAIEDRLQAKAHTVGSAKATNPEAFDQGWVESSLSRALVIQSALAVTGVGLDCLELPNGGIEAVAIEDGVERSFRFKGSKKIDLFGRPVVMVGSDSLLNRATPNPDLFGNHLQVPPPIREAWVLAYRLRPALYTFDHVWAARVTGTRGKKAPLRLQLADVVPIPFDLPLPPEFRRGKDDDLGLPDEDEGLGEPGE